MNCYSTTPDTSMEARYQPPVQAAEQRPIPSGFNASMARTEGASDAFRAFQERVSTNPDQPEVLEAPLAHIRKCLDEMQVEDLAWNVTDKRVQELYGQWQAIAVGLMAHVGAGAGRAIGIGADAMYLLAAITEHNAFVQLGKRCTDPAPADGETSAPFARLVGPTHSMHLDAARSKQMVLSLLLERSVSTLSDRRAKVDWAAVVPLELGPAFAASRPPPSTRMCYDMARDGDFKTFQATHGRQFHAEVEEGLNAIAARIEPAAARTRAQTHFAEFREHLKSDYFAPHTAQMWLEAKAALDLLAAAANNPEVPADTLQRAFAILIDGLTVCGPGICTNLREACLTIGGGPCAGAIKTWEDDIQGIILEYLTKAEPNLAPEIEVHGVNAYRNLLAPHMKIPEQRDDFVNLFRPQFAQNFTDGADLVKERVTPARLPMSVGAQYFDRLTEAFATEGRKSADGKVSLEAVGRILNGYKDQYGDLVGHHVTVDKGNDDWAPGGRNSIAAAITHNLMDSGVLCQQAAATLMHTGDRGEVRRLGYAIFVAEEGVYREVTDEEWARLVDTAPHPISLTQALSEQSTALDLGLCVAMKQRDVALQEWADLVKTHLDQSPRVKGELQVDGWLRGILQSQHLSAADKQALLSVALQQACRTGRHVIGGTGRHVVGDTCLEALHALAPADRRKILENVPAHAAGLRCLLMARALRANEPTASALFEELKGTVTADELKGAVTRMLKSRNDPLVSFMYSAMAKGHARTIETVGEMMKFLSPEDLRDFLAAKGRPNEPAGLFRALENGHTAAIAAYGKLLKQATLSPELRREILMAKTPAGIPGFAIAMQNGHHEALVAYGRVLEPEILREIMVTDKGEFPGLNSALDNGHAKAIAAYGDLLLQTKLAPRVLAEILAAKRSDGINGLSRALQNGQHEAIAAYGELLMRARLEPRALAEIFQAAMANRVPGFYVAMQNGHPKAISTFGALLLQAELEPGILVEILKAKRADGVVGLFAALQLGRSQAIAAYGDLLRKANLQPNELLEILKAESSDYGNGLFIALQEGHPEAIVEYGDLLLQAQLEPGVLAQILTGKREIDGATALNMALQKGHHEAIARYVTLLQAAKLDALDLRKILMTQANDGVPGLSRALRGGHADALAQLGPLLRTLDDKEKVDFLECKKSDKQSGVSICMNGPLELSRKAATMRAYLGLIESANIRDPHQRKRLALIVKESTALFSMWPLTLLKSKQYKKLNKSHPEFGAEYLACIKKLERPESKVISKGNQSISQPSDKLAV
ncbi:hypothetical protein [Variovorax saccharolyticus]|uniref:hypothetical protein n=1 Tax=Variovorax saccharolyticus TaxID=3053516 RepID=UPI002574C4FC|nr:hypothetical protein [Variovorax sp. J31P216]MDM0029089.1 hypothetical protein [Variovorax sp. J31P216]